MNPGGAEEAAVTAPRLVLEPQQVQHAAAMYPLLAEPALYEFIEQAPPDSEGALRERFKRLEARRSPDGSQQWLNWVLRLQDGRLAGYVQATVFDDDGTANVAYVLGKDFWGQGLARHATALMLDLLAREHGVRRAFATVDARNQRSLRLLQALGFKVLVPSRWPQLPNVRPQAGDVLLGRTLRRP
jgi:RimJ/RimL family protein N-acetyltransferase